MIACVMCDFSEVTYASVYTDSFQCITRGNVIAEAGQKLTLSLGFSH